MAVTSETEAADLPDRLAGWRERTLNQTLWLTAAAASIAYVPAILAAASKQLWLLILFDSLAWASVVFLALARRLPFVWRAGSFIVLWLLFASYLLWTTGPMGNPGIWLLCVPVFGSLLFGPKGAGAGLGALTVVAVAYGLTLHPWDLRPTQNPFVYDLLGWLSATGSLLCLGTLLAVTLVRQLRGLERALADLDAANQHLTAALAERLPSRRSCCVPRS